MPWRVCSYLDIELMKLIMSQVGSCQVISICLRLFTLEKYIASYSSLFTTKQNRTMTVSCYPVKHFSISTLMIESSYWVNEWNSHMIIRGTSRVGGAKGARAPPWSGACKQVIAIITDFFILWKVSYANSSVAAAIDISSTCTWQFGKQPMFLHQHIW